MSAISALEARIRGLNRTVNLDARTSASGGGGGGMSGAAIPLAAAALAGGGGRGGSSSASGRIQLRRQQIAGTVDTAKMQAMSEVTNKIAEAEKKLASSREKLNKATAVRDAKTDQIKQLDAQYENIRTVMTGKQKKARFGWNKEINDLDNQSKAIKKLATGLMAEKRELINNAHAADQLNKEREKAVELLKDEKEVLSKGSKELRKELQLSDEQKKVQGDLNKLKVDESKLENKLNQKKDAIAAAENRVTKAKNELAQSQGRVNKGLNVNQETLKKQQKELGNANRQLASNNRWYNQWKKEAKEVGTEIEKLEAKQRSLNTAVKQMPKGGLMGQLRGGFKDIGGMKGAMGAAGKGALASAALIPGVAPLAVGGFAGAAGAKTAGAAAVGGGIGVAVAAAVQGTVALVEFARASANVAAEMDRMRVALSGVVPDQESYNNSLNKITKISTKYALSQKTILKGFTQLQASADAAGFTVEDTGKLMEGLLARTLASGKGIEEFKGVMLAASQILSKGKLQAEEARGQIGERIPGFMADLAASMGVSMKELDKMMEQGEVTLQHFFKLGEDLLANNEKIAVKMANSYANAGARLEASTEKLQIALGGRSMIIGAKFQQGLKGVVDTIEKVIFGLNQWRIAELKLGIAIRKRIRSAFGKDPDANLNSAELRDREELRILTGEQEILTKAKKKKIETDLQDAAQKAANWKKIEDRLKIDTQFQKNRIELGDKEAEIQRELAELRLQFPDRNLDEIEEKIRALKDLEDQTMSNSAAFKELQESAAQRLKDLQNPINQLKTITEAFEDSFSNAMREVVKGTKSIGDAVSSMLNRIADAMIQNAADMAAAAASNALMKFLGNAFASSFGNSLSNTTSLPTDVGGLTMTEAVSLPAIKYASGGYVDRPTSAVIGEGSEGEYIIPESKLASSLSRYQAGHRGNSVVPGGVGNSGGSGGGSGEVTVNYTGPTLNFNGDEYVPRAAVPQIINSAAMAGASAGRANTMKDLKNSRSQRARLGL